MEIILFIQKMASSFWDTVNIGFTIFGEKLFFIAIFMICYWILDKDFSVKMCIVFLFNALVNFSIKNIVKAPRPDPEIVRRMFDSTATGYSFPSGHAQAVSLYTSSLTYKYARRSKLAIIIGVLLVLCVAFSRMYLGVHFLQDVLIGAVLGYAIGFFGTMLVEKININKWWYLILLLPMAIMLCLSQDATVILSVGGGFGAVLGYVFENKFVKCHDKPRTVLYGILRLVLGFGIAVGFYFGFIAIFGNGKLASFFMYFLLGTWVTFLAPLLFKLIENHIAKTPSLVGEITKDVKTKKVKCEVNQTIKHDGKIDIN